VSRAGARRGRRAGRAPRRGPGGDGPRPGATAPLPLPSPSQGAQLDVPDPPRAGLHAQAGLLPPGPEAGEPPVLKGHGQDCRLRPGAGDPVAAPLHGLRVDAMVPGARGAAAVAILQRADRHVRDGGHHGRALHPAPALPRVERGRRDLQDRQRPRDPHAAELGRGAQARRRDELPLPAVPGHAPLQGELPRPAAPGPPASRGPLRPPCRLWPGPHPPPPAPPTRRRS